MQVRFFFSPTQMTFVPPYSGNSYLDLVTVTEKPCDDKIIYVVSFFCQFTKGLNGSVLLNTSFSHIFV
jgi:hypothetical protein